jgi:threonine dehydrogenase-like Zn-dependent dehydrogenase
MLDHMILTVSDIRRSLAFYDAALKPLQIKFFMPYKGEDGHPDLWGFGDGKKAFFWIKQGKPDPTAIHWGFMAENKKQVDQFYVGDGAVGLLGVLSAKQMGAERIIAMSRHASRQKLAREFGATDIVTERGNEGVARIKELTKGIGADAVLECVGTQESMMQAIHSTRPGGSVGYVGVPHGVDLEGEGLFYAHVRLHGGPAPVRRFLPDLIDRVLNGKINPGKVFDLTLPLDQVAEGYRAMDERRAIKTLLRP